MQQYAKDIHLYLENYREKENVQNADQKILKEKYQEYGIVQNAITKWQIYHMTQQQSNKNKFKFTAEITISSKNNSTAEKMLESIKPDLDKEDKIRDSITGGGNSRVTYFDGKSQLPNFLLMDPSSEYPGAMKMNGIHEGSL